MCKTYFRIWAYECNSAATQWHFDRGAAVQFMYFIVRYS